MELININGIGETPNVILDPSRGLITIKGRSVLTNAHKFYKPIINWVEDYCNNPAPFTEVKIQLEYFNTSSSKCIFDILKKLEVINTRHTDKKVVINWHYEYDDEEMLNNCEFYENLLKIDFIKIPYLYAKCNL